MSKDASLTEQSITDLADLYTKLKTRAKADKARAAKEGEMMLENLMCIASGGGLGYLMGQRYAQAEIDAMAENKTGEDLKEAIAEGGQIAGIDLDLLVGAAATAAGMFQLGGKMSGAVRQVGVGGLTAYAARVGHNKGFDGVKNPDPE